MRYANHEGLFKYPETKKDLKLLKKLDKTLTSMEELEKIIVSGYYDDTTYNKYLSYKKLASRLVTKLNLADFRSKQYNVSSQDLRDFDVDLNRLNFGKEIPP